MGLLAQFKHVLTRRDTMAGGRLLDWKDESVWEKGIDKNGQAYKRLSLKRVSSEDVARLAAEIASSGVLATPQQTKTGVALCVVNPDSLDLLNMYLKKEPIVPYGGIFQFQNWQGDQHRITLEVPSRYALVENNRHALLKELIRSGVQGCRQETVPGYRYRQRLTIEGAENISIFKEACALFQKAFQMQKEELLAREAEKRRQEERLARVRDEAMIVAGLHLKEPRFWEDIVVQSQDGKTRSAMRLPLSNAEQGYRFKDYLIAIGVPEDSLRVSKATRTTEKVKEGEWALRVSGKEAIHALKLNLFHECMQIPSRKKAPSPVLKIVRSKRTH